MAHAQDDYDHLRESADAASKRPHVLVVMPDGHAILTTPEILNADQRETLVGLLQVWKDSPAAIAVMDGVEVVQVVSVDLEPAAS